MKILTQQFLQINFFWLIGQYKCTYIKYRIYLSKITCVVKYGKPRLTIFTTKEDVTRISSSRKYFLISSRIKVFPSLYNLSLKQPNSHIYMTQVPSLIWGNSFEIQDQKNLKNKFRRSFLLKLGSNRPEKTIGW